MSAPGKGKDEPRNAAVASGSVRAAGRFNRIRIVAAVIAACVAIAVIAVRAFLR